MVRLQNTEEMERELANAQHHKPTTGTFNIRKNFRAPSKLYSYPNNRKIHSKMFAHMPKFLKIRNLFLRNCSQNQASHLNAQKFGYHKGEKPCVEKTVS